MTLEASQVDVWLARDLQLHDAAVLERLSRALSADEHARVARMHFPEGRHQQLVTRGLARIVLSHYLPEVAPADWRFERGEHGRPFIAREMPEAARALNFNLAHATGLVVMAVARAAQIGVDVERVDARVNLALARRYFSAAEASALDALPPEARPRFFQRLWTLKEAYLKAIGTGMVGGLGSMTFHLDDRLLRFERDSDADASRWVFNEFAVADEYLLALAILHPDRAAVPVVTLREFPPDSG